MHGQQENRDLSDIYQEGIMSRFGARVAGVKAGTGQYFKNIGSAVTGKAAPVSAADASRDAKAQVAYKSATKNLLTDLKKLGLLPKEQVPQQTSNQVTATLASLVDQMQQATPAPQSTSPSPVPANVPKQPVAAPAPITAPTPKLAQPAATPVSLAAQRKATQTKGGTAVGQLSPGEEAKFKATLPSHPLTSKTPANRVSAERLTQLTPPVASKAQTQAAAPEAPQTGAVVSGENGTFTFDGKQWVAADGGAVSQGVQDYLTGVNKAQGSKTAPNSSGKKQLTPEQRAKRNASRRANRAAKKAASDESNEEFAFSANLPFNKFFGNH